MTIVNRSMYPLSQGYATIKSMQARADQLNVQLGTGKLQQTLADYGSQRSLALQVRERLARIEGYQQNGNTVQLRLDVLDTVMTRMDKLEAEARGSAISGGYGANDLNLVNMPTLSMGRLDELVTLLNTEVSGRYLFGGTSTEQKPVANAKIIMDGENGRAGFRTVVQQRILADSGTDGLGRLDLTRAGTAVSLAEDGTHPFGLKLSTLSTTSAGITLTQPTGAPPALAIDVTGTVTEGQRIDIGLTLPDGTETSITLTAVTGTPNQRGEFQIGATATDTATNLQAALQTALEWTGDTQLVAASTFAAADNFFNGTGQTVMRVAGPPYETATALVAATPTDTVMWYKGGDSTDPRSTAVGKVDDATVVAYGAQANETAFINMMRSLAAMAVGTYTSADPTAHARFDMVAQIQNDRLSESKNSDPGSIELMTLEFGQAEASIGNAKDRQKAYKAQLDTMLAGVEQAPLEETAMELLALKTRLEASYATTSALANLSLVNYLR